MAPVGTTGLMAARRDNEPPYESPDPALVKRISLRELLPGTRLVPDAQQARVGGIGPEDAKLWCVGDISLISRPCVAIVGTRKVSSDGAARARRLAKELVEAGVVVVSGLAEGVDTQAHSAAIAARGSTIAVIGTAIDRAFPSANRRLQERIYREQLLITQFAPGATLGKWAFPARNRLMAALSDATVIIEASDTSGTLHQAAECMRLDRWLFISKTVVGDLTLKWPDSFLRQPKAKILTSTADVLAVLSSPR
jgi:DNA processing protein